MPSSKGPTIPSLAPTPTPTRLGKPPPLNLGPTTSKSRRRPAGLYLNLGLKSTQNPVQTIHQFCDAEKVNQQIKEGCDRILRLDENGRFINITDEYKINFDDKNIITTLDF
mgnify:CR=1 FL=1